MSGDVNLRFAQLQLIVGRQEAGYIRTVAEPTLFRQNREICMSFPHRTWRFLSPPLVVLVLALIGAYGPRASGEERPVLVVAVSVDQLAYDYLQRFHKNFSDKGIFRRCQEQGAWFTNCHHRHAFTYTAPGHAVLLTGCYASEHSIVENDWFDRATGKKVYCVSDPDAKLIGTTIDDPLVSPRNLLADTLGDRLKTTTGGKAKVFGVAIKDRASILMAGHLADAAYWMSNDGKWITCDHYRNDLPGYLRELNENGAVQRFGGQTWDRLLKPEEYLHGATENSFGERPFAGASADFPHELVAASDKNYVKQLAGSPFGNQAALEAAITVLVHEDLGADDVPDLLCINLSSNDYVGHAFGPHSLEVEDMTYHTDEQLGEFVRLVDKQLDGRPWVFALTADHAVAPVPEVMQQQGLSASRNPLGKANREGSYEAVAVPLEKLLRTALQVSDDEKSPLVQAVTENEVFLFPDHAALAGENFATAQRLTRDYLLQHPLVAAAVTRAQLLDGGVSTRLEQMLRRSFHPTRSGDVLFVMRPYHFSNEAATTHGSPWQYDTHVPLLLLAGGGDARDAQVTLRPGRYTAATSPAQLAPTLARLLGVTAPAMCAEEAIDAALK
jgi:hypothetical protein